MASALKTMQTSIDDFRKDMASAQHATAQAILAMTRRLEHVETALGSSQANSSNKNIFDCVQNIEFGVMEMYELAKDPHANQDGKYIIFYCYLFL